MVNVKKCEKCGCNYGTFGPKIVVNEIFGKHVYDQYYSNRSICHDCLIDEICPKYYEDGIVKKDGTSVVLQKPSLYKKIYWENLIIRYWDGERQSEAKIPFIKQSQKKNVCN